MKGRLNIASLALSLLGAGGPCLAQVAPPEEDPELVSLRAEFEYGKFDDVLERAASRINRGNLSEGELIELHRLAGLSAFYLKKMPVAERHLVAVIQLDPDYNLDPFVVPPPAIKYFEKLRSDHARELDPIREQKRLRAERVRREAEERERQRRETEEQRRRIEQLSNRLTVERVETRSYVVNFLPFGAGQFQQGRNRAGAIFAATEGILAVTSIIAYFAYAGQIQRRSTPVTGFLSSNGGYTFVEDGIPPDRRSEATAWRNVKYGAGGGFWLVYGIGVVDALYHHQDQVVIRTTVEPSPNPNPPPSQPARTKASLLPVSGGVGAGLTLNF